MMMGSRKLDPATFGVRRSSTAAKHAAAALAAAALCAPPVVRAQDAPQDSSPLQAHVSFTQFLQGPIVGGLNNDASYGGRIDIDAKLDTHLLGLWEGGALVAKLATRYGDSASPDAGVISPVNTQLIDPDNNGTSTALITLNYQQLVPWRDRPGDLLAFAIGKFYTIDLPTEVFEAGSGVTRFMNVSFIAPLTEARNVPSVTVGATAAVLMGGQPVFTLALFDPRSSQRTSGLNDLFGDGITLVPAVIVPTKFFDRPGHQQLRATWSSQRTIAFAEIPRIIIPVPDDTTGFDRERGSWSLTWSADQFIRALPGPPLTGWGVFWQLGLANQKTSPVSAFAAVGFGGNSPISRRVEDFWGIGYAWNHISPELSDVFEPLVDLRDEHVVELFYNWKALPFFRLTADLQVVRPTRPRADTAVLPGLRGQLTF
jgi:carbohydrate-selective porin OprB